MKSPASASSPVPPWWRLRLALPILWHAPGTADGKGRDDDMTSATSTTSAFGRLVSRRRGRGGETTPTPAATAVTREENRRLADSRPPSARTSWLVATALLLFLVWSNTFIGIGLLLGGERSAARFDWVSLTSARFAVVFPICLVYCLLPRHRAVTWAVLRRHWRRLLLSGFLAVPGYNLALYYGQEHGVPAPVASLATTLAPIFILVLSIAFLGERLTPRRLAGFFLCLLGMGVISFARGTNGAGAYPLLVAITALAPACWALFSVLTKPMTAEVDPTHWTYLAVVVGSLPGMLVLPWIGGPEMLRLDATGWAWLLYLALLATVLGFAAWSWLLRHLPASTVGLTIFLNPPLTTLSKVILAAALPATFAVHVTLLEGVGGVIVLGGLALAVRPKRVAATR